MSRKAHAQAQRRKGHSSPPLAGQWQAAPVTPGYANGSNGETSFRRIG